MKSRNLKSKLLQIPILFIFICLAVVMLLPIVWMLLSSFKPDNEIIKYPPTLFPTAYTLKNFIKCTQRIDIWVYLKNSFIYSFGATIPSLLVNTMAGYAFARYNFKGKDIIFVIFLATMMIPFQVIMIPSFLEVHALGMYDNYAGLIIPKIAAAYWIFMMRSAFSGLPKELEEPYQSYNVLQRAQGFDLEPCCGKTVERCTYTVKNHPSGKVCQADLYICGGEIVAGDILCTGEGGFIAPLAFPKDA